MASDAGEAGRNGPAPPFDLDRIGGRATFDALLEEVVTGGEEALRWWQAVGHAERADRKGDGSPVTKADRALEARLRSWWRRFVPQAAFLGEESGHGAAAGGREQASSELRLVVDPIDGTQAFVRGLESWSVLVSLEDAHGPALAVAFLPARGELFTAVRGGGAYRDGRPLRLSRTERLEHALVLHGALGQFAAAGRVELLGRLAEDTATQRGPGDFEGYRLLLEGRADAVIDPALQPWDVSAPSLLVHEAGGRMTTFQGGPGHLGGDVVASNGRLHDELLAWLADRNG